MRTGETSASVETVKPPVSRWRKVGAGLFLALALLLAFAANTWKEHLRVKQVEVEGNSIVQEDVLRQLSGVKTGSPLFQVDLNRVRTLLMGNPFIREATVQRDAPGRIVLSVVERVPVAAAVGSRMHFLDDEGFVMPAISSGRVFDVPVLSGTMLPDELQPGKRIASTHVLNALALAKRLQMLEGVNPRISEVHITHGGDIVLFTTEGGIPVFVGREDYQRKLLSFQAFWEQVVLKEDVRRLELVDIRFQGQVIARWGEGGRKQG